MSIAIRASLHGTFDADTPLLMKTPSGVDLTLFVEQVRETAAPSKVRIVREYLPDIDIAVSIEPRLFLERMAALAEASSAYLVERHYNVDMFGNERFDIFNLRWQAESLHDEPGVQLIADSDNEMRVSVELRAFGWTPDPPTRTAYCDFAKQTVRALLRMYNTVYRTSYRLRIQKPGKPYRLPPQSEQLFRRFAITANTHSLHVLDWRRFYEFIRLSRTEAPEGALRGLLIEHGFPEVTADELSSLYRHLWAFKRSHR